MLHVAAVQHWLFHLLCEQDGLKSTRCAAEELQGQKYCVSGGGEDTQTLPGLQSQNTLLIQ